MSEDDYRPIQLPAQDDHPSLIPRGIEAMVCKDIAERQRLGINKYGTTVMESNEIGLRPWLQHAYEECLDQAIYLRRAIEEIEK